MRLTIGAGSTFGATTLVALAAAAANAPLMGNGFGMLDAANLPPLVGLPFPLVAFALPLAPPPPTDAIFANAATAAASCENLH